MEYSQSASGNPRLSQFSLISADLRAAARRRDLAKASAWNSNRRLNHVMQKDSSCKNKDNGISIVLGKI